MPKGRLATAFTACTLGAGLALFSATTAGSASEQAIIDKHLTDTIAQNLSKASSFTDEYSRDVWFQHAAANLAPFKNIPQHEKEAITLAVHRYAMALELRPDLVMSVIEIESSFDRFALSVAGANGLMQIMPFWLKAMQREDANLNDIDTNIRWGCAILAYYIERENGNIMHALQRYNGNHRDYRYASKVMSRWQDYWYTGEAMPWEQPLVTEAH